MEYVYLFASPLLVRCSAVFNSKSMPNLITDLGESWNSCDIRHHTQLNVCNSRSFSNLRGHRNHLASLLGFQFQGPSGSNTGAPGWAGDTGCGATEKSTIPTKKKPAFQLRVASQLKTSTSWHLQDPPSFLSHNQCSLVGVTGRGHAYPGGALPGGLCSAAPHWLG